MDNNLISNSTNNVLTVVKGSLSNLPMPSQSAIDNISVTVAGSACVGGLICIIAGAAAFVSKYCDFEAQYKDAKVKVSRTSSCE